MKKISSDLTPVVKKGIPVLFVFLIAVYFLTFEQLSADLAQSNAPIPKWFIPFIPYQMIVVAIGVWWFLIRDLTDEVYDKQDRLYFKNGNMEATVHLRDIESITYNGWVSPARVIVKTNVETNLGKKLAFVAQGGMVTPFNTPGDIQKLIGRVEKANQSIE